MDVLIQTAGLLNRVKYAQIGDTYSIESEVRLLFEFTTTKCSIFNGNCPSADSAE